MLRAARSLYCPRCPSAPAFRNRHPRETPLSDLRARRAAVLFLLALTLIVCARAIAAARGATPSAPPAPAFATPPARIALFDPERRAEGPLRALGLSPEIIARPEDLTLFEGNLIVVGPGGFGRGREDLGPVLAARLRGGLPILLLDQPAIPGTLSDDLRLWPSFSANGDSEVTLSGRHPVLRGLSAADASAYFVRSRSRNRPYLAPTRGNFAVIAEVRARSGPAWQEGIAMLEIMPGDGRLLAIQAPLCGDFPTEPQARALLANAVSYLVEPRVPRPRVALFGAGSESLPPCLQKLAPYLPAAPPDLEGVDLLIAPADWQALQARNLSNRPPLTRAARFLREGGTLVLFNPQPLVLDGLAALTGSVVSFQRPGEARLPATSAETPAILQGIAPDDLRLLARPDGPEMRLRATAADPDGVEPLQIAPGLVRYRVGRGVLMALTLPDAAECSSAATSSLVARLLTNLGVPLDADAGRAPRAISRLDEAGD